MTVTECLARDFTFEVNTGTHGSPVWVGINGINTWSHSPTKNDADTTTFDDDGRMSHLPASRGDGFGIQGLYHEDPETGERDAGQAACDAWAQGIGPVDGIREFRITSPAGNTRTFEASASVTSGGGGNDDPNAWSCDMTVTGAITSSDVSDVPVAPTSPTGVAGDTSILVSWSGPSSGSPFLAYEAVAYVSGTEVARVLSSTEPIYIGGLTNDIAHTVKVRALNAYGWGPLSVASSNITPTD